MSIDECIAYLTIWKMKVVDVYVSVADQKEMVRYDPVGGEEGGISQLFPILDQTLL